MFSNGCPRFSSSRKRAPIVRADDDCAGGACAAETGSAPATVPPATRPAAWMNSRRSMGALLPAPDRLAVGELRADEAAGRRAVLHRIQPHGDEVARLEG